ncbi:uncharacterized serine-rich protein C215.13-like [Prosopis cineraria]|uniref:uncharacterized serine-rich protein C215.13-like n=1 Tax=Prosopis cineraria TaxID=364024 RepID=UPI00240F825E|nr:uncharacterized serine-rich protein C215.13-like [Prosopis cineraria]
MASACVNNIAMSPDNFLDSPPRPSFPWLSPPKSHPPHFPDPRPSPSDFEFSLQDPVAMLPADQLFSNGKLVPLHLASLPPSSTAKFPSPDAASSAHVSAADPSFFSPKAPRCSSRWKDLLGLKKLCHAHTTCAAAKSDPQKTTSSSLANISLKHFLHRTPKSSSSSSSAFLSSSLDASLSLPLLKESDCESVSISSRHSLSSSSSGHEYEDLPRLSLDSDKLNPNPISLHRNPNSGRPRMRMVKPRAGSFDGNNQRSQGDHPSGSRVGRSPVRRAPGESGGVGSRGVSVDSPRMNSSGKIVFQSLERSSSSPSTLNGGPRYRQKGMERSYSANVRVTPVLNVPVCSLRGSSKSGSVFGFGQLFSSPQKKEGSRGHQQQSHGRNRCDRN